MLESRADGFKPGDRVLAAPQPRFGRCFAQRQVVPAGSLVHLPDGSDPGLQVLGQQLGAVVFAMRRFWPAGHDRERGGSVAIFGTGAAGLLFVQLARLAGFAKIIVSDLTESRLARPLMPNREGPAGYPAAPALVPPSPVSAHL